jgi:hypothetical protein
MGVDLNWGLAAQQPNLAGGYIQSFETGRQIGRQRQVQNALASFAANPQDPSSINALMAVDPETGMRLQQYQRQEQLRSGLAGAYNPETGAIDAAKVRQAYVGAGDVGGAMQFDQQQRAEKLAQIDILHKVNDYGLQLLGGVTDQASYDQATAQAKAMYEQYGVPFPQLPVAYSPGVVRALQMRSLSAKDQLDAAAREASAAETHRHNTVVEGQGSDRITLARQSEARIAKGAAAKGGNVTEMSTADLLKIAGGE